MNADTRWDETFDVVVLRAGAGGMSAALVSVLEGRRVLLLESTQQVGGTAARSSGTVWIPNNPHQRHLDSSDDAAAARSYLDALVSDRAEPSLRHAFVDAGSLMIEYLEARTDVRFQAFPASPDYRQELPGAAQGGRPLEPLPFDGRTLREHFDRLASPLPELMLFGGMMVTRGEAARLLRAPTSLDGFLLGARLVTRYGADRLRFKRGTRLVLGNALVGRLYRNLLDRRVPIWFGAQTLRLATADDGAVIGVIVQTPDGERQVRALGGVILAGSPVAPSFVARMRTAQLRSRLARGVVKAGCHINSMSGRFWRKLVNDAGLDVEIHTGTFLIRWSKNPLENSAIWMRLNQAWGALFPSLGGELYLSARKPAAE